MSHPHLLKVSRLEALTDGVFAIAMTLLVLDLKIPPHDTLTNLPLFLATVIPLRLIVYMSSFIILGTLWIAMNFQTGLLDHLNRTYLWTHVLYLMIICIIPFSANLVASYPHSYASISFFAANLLCSSMTQLLIMQCAHHFKLNNASYTNKVRLAAVRRIFVAPAFYIASLVVSHWNTALAFILVVAPIVVYMFPGRIDKFND